MSVAPPSHARASSPESTTSPQRPIDAAGERWAALSAAAGLVGTLAGLEADRSSADTCDFAALLRDAEPWRRERAGQGVADLAAIMEPGIAALLAVNARGADPRPAALALWREFAAAREAILTLLPLARI